LRRNARCGSRPLVFVRPGELRKAQWSEIDLEKAEWRIPARPNARLHVFPSTRSRERPMSNNAVLAALRCMGYSKNEMTGHGFRSMASTLLHERGWNHQVIERQLAHAERNAVSAAYNFAEHLPERRKMMQAWADYLDALKARADVIPLFKKA
jgi:integrase